MGTTWIDPADPPVEYHDGGIDWRRVMLAVDAAGIVVRESLSIGLDYDRDVVVISDDDLGEILSIERWRVASFDPERLRHFAAKTLARLDPGLADELLEVINDGRSTVIDEPDDDWVRVHVNDYPLMAVHRRGLIPGWPQQQARASAIEG